MHSDNRPENRPLSLPTWKGSQSKRMFIHHTGINTSQIVSFYNLHSKKDRGAKHRGKEVFFQCI